MKALQAHNTHFKSFATAKYFPPGEAAASAPPALATIRTAQRVIPRRNVVAHELQTYHKETVIEDTIHGRIILFDVFPRLRFPLRCRYAYCVQTILQYYLTLPVVSAVHRSSPPIGR